MIDPLNGPQPPTADQVTETPLPVRFAASVGLPSAGHGVDVAVGDAVGVALGRGAT